MKKLTLAVCILAMLSSCKENEKAYIGRSDIRIENGVMTPQTLLALGRLSDPQISPDGMKILYGVSYTDIEKNKSCRNLFICDRDGSNAVQLTRYASSVSNARWSLDGQAVYFIQDAQIWKAPLKGNRLGKKVRLSDVSNGISEFKLSPDQTRLIYLSSIRNTLVEIPSESGLDKAEAYATEDLMYRHWDHWVTETPRSYLASVGKETITDTNSIDILGEEPFELPTEPFGGLEQLDWSADGKKIAYSCRKLRGKQYAFSTNTGIYLYDTESGCTTGLKTDGGYDTDPVWSPDGRYLAWLSMERDGYEADRQRLFVCDTSDWSYREILPGFDHDVQSPAWFGSDIFFCSLVQEGVQAIFRTDCEGSGPERLTPADRAADFFTPFAVEEKDGTLSMLSSYYSLNFPTELVSIEKNGEDCIIRQISAENGHILSQLDEPTSEAVHIKTVDGKDMHCWVIYPPKFDSTKVYPAIEIVLGGPQGTNSQDWSYRWCYRLMAQQGYIVILPNRRGTTAFGQEWKEQISGDYPGLNMQDYLSAGRWLKSKPYVGKLACTGASYGGYSVYMLAGMHEGLYDCFIAHAGIFDEQQMWFTTEEMWFPNFDNGGLSEYAYSEGKSGPEGDGVTFGGMQQAGAPYSSRAKAVRHYANSPVANLTKWDTPILCIHGGRDYRIPYEQGMAAFNAAQMMGVPSRLLVFPEENHWILKPQNSLYWHREFFNWLARWTK